MPNWSEKQTALQLWMGTPKEWRRKETRTLLDICRHLGIDREIVAKWMIEPGWWDQVFANSRYVVGSRTADILNAMVERAVGGSVQAAKLCLQVLGVHAEKLETVHTFDSDQLVVIMRPENDVQQQPLLEETNETAR